MGINSPNYKVSKNTFDKNSEIWYDMRIYSSELRRWVKSQNPKYWRQTETIIDYSINEQLFTLLALK